MKGRLGAFALTALALAGCETAVEPKEQEHELGCVAGMMTGAVVGGLVGGAIGAGEGERIGASVGAAAGVIEGTRLTCDPGGGTAA